MAFLTAVMEKQQLDRGGVYCGSLLEGAVHDGGWRRHGVWNSGWRGRACNIACFPKDQ